MNYYVGDSIAIEATKAPVKSGDNYVLSDGKAVIATGYENQREFHFVKGSKRNIFYRTKRWKKATKEAYDAKMAEFRKEIEGLF